MMKRLESYIEEFETGKLSRRQFMHGLAGLGLSASVAGSLLATTGREVAAATPKRGGRLRIAFTEGSQKEHWDPAKRYSRMMNGRNHSVYNTLVNVSSNLTAEPSLAESWEANDTADLWQFKLRKGVEFHDGRSLRAEDVVYSVRRVMDPETGSGGKSFVAGVESVKAVDAHTVEFKLNGSNVDFPMFLGTDFLSIVADGASVFTTANGTGPFKVDFFEAARSALVVRNPNYWESGLPYLDECETFSISDDVARLNALISGDIHCLEKLSPSLIEKVQGTEGIDLLSSPSGYRVTAIMRTDLAPYDNPDVRQALKLLIDREKYIQIVYKGQAEIGNDHPIAPIYPEFCSDLPLHQYDPEKAMALLKKAGAEKEVFEVLVSTVGIGAIEGAQVYSQMAAKAGVTIQPTKVPTDGFWDAVWMKKPFHFAHWQMRATTNLQLHAAFSSESSWNDSFWYRDRFDAMLTEARGTFDKARRKELYCECQKMVSDDAGQIIPAFPKIIDAVSSKLKGIEPNPMGSLGNLKVQNTCWLEA